jgi:hypothetical protein
MQRIGDGVGLQKGQPVCQLRELSICLPPFAKTAKIGAPFVVMASARIRASRFQIDFRIQV